MKITKLKAVRFRNFENELLYFEPGVTIFYGRNGQGKTNFLEAIAFLSSGRSFRVKNDRALLNRAYEKSAYIAADYTEDNVKKSVEALLYREGNDLKKSIKMNKTPLKSIKELFSGMRTVTFSPEDVRTVYAGPAVRRSFLDAEISKIIPSYVDALKTYDRLIAMKNKILKEENVNRDLLEVYDAQLSPLISLIVRNRLKYVDKLNEMLPHTVKNIAGIGETARISYINSLKDEDPAQALLRAKDREIALKSSFLGPHRDDVAFFVNDARAQDSASQGQMRTLMLAVKLACKEIFRQGTGACPILLLDDVFSELDSSRKRRLLKSVSDTQTFITSTDGEPGVDAARFEVVEGKAYQRR